MPGSTELQALIDLGGTVTIPAGTRYDLTTSLLIDANVHLVNNGIIRRAYEGTAGQRSWSTFALFRNRSFATPVHNFSLTGHGLITARQNDGTLYRGKIMSLLGNNMSFQSVKMDGWKGGQAMFVAGDSMRIMNVRITGTTAEVGNGGIRIVGGDGIRVIDCHVESGDDCIQAVSFNNDNGENVLNNLAINDVKYHRCTGSSSFGRFIAIIVDDAITQDITNISFVRCTGTGAKRGLIIANHENVVDDSAVLSNVRIAACQLTMAANSDNSFDGDIYIKKSSNLLFDRCGFHNFANQWITMAGGGTPNESDTIAFQRCAFTDMQGDTANRPEPGITIGQIDNATINRCTFTGGKSGGSVAINITANAVGTTITNNDFTGCNYASAVSDSGSGSTISGNIGP